MEIQQKSWERDKRRQELILSLSHHEALQLTARKESIRRTGQLPKRSFNLKDVVSGRINIPGAYRNVIR